MVGAEVFKLRSHMMIFLFYLIYGDTDDFTNQRLERGNAKGGPDGFDQLNNNFPTALPHVSANPLARIFHELESRDREDGRLTGQPQELGPEGYLNSTSQGSWSEDDRRTAISTVVVGNSSNMRAN